MNKFQLRQNLKAYLQTSFETKRLISLKKKGLQSHAELLLHDVGPVFFWFIEALFVLEHDLPAQISLYNFVVYSHFPRLSSKVFMSDVFKCLVFAHAHIVVPRKFDDYGSCNSLDTIL